MTNNFDTLSIQHWAKKHVTLAQFIIGFYPLVAYFIFILYANYFSVSAHLQSYILFCIKSLFFGYLGLNIFYRFSGK